MSLNRLVPVLVLSFASVTPAAAQNGELADGGGAREAVEFYVIPLVETAFGGTVRWRPDWPLTIPPDGFYLDGADEPCDIELAGEAETFAIRRDSEGRLAEFPFFQAAGYGKVQAIYAASGALEAMSVSFFSGGASAGSDGVNEKTWEIEFPPDFFPYSDWSPGGTFPPARVVSNDSVFHVFFFESPAFFSETWYGEDGTMLSFCKALVNHEDGVWRARALQFHDAEGPRFEDYYFDSAGNITELRFQGRVFSALYLNGRPRFWNHDGARFDLQWDTQGALAGMWAREAAEYPAVEYRYEYKRDVWGNWVERQEAAFGTQYDLAVPMPSLSRGMWTRRIGASAAQR